MPDRPDITELEEVFRQVFRKAKSYTNSFECEGLNSTMAVILLRLEEEGPQKVSQLADALWITPGAVTGFSDKLVAEGYAERERSEQDRRVVYLSITDKGRGVAELLRQYRRQFSDKLFGVLPQDDVQHLIRIFRQILNESDKS
jgi:DNA-binding MarR family transcriptional regulator